MAIRWTQTETDEINAIVGRRLVRERRLFDQRASEIHARYQREIDRLQAEIASLRGQRNVLTRLSDRYFRFSRKEMEDKPCDQPPTVNAREK